MRHKLGRPPLPPPGITEVPLAQSVDAFMAYIRARCGDNASTPTAKAVVVSALTEMFPPQRAVWTLTSGDLEDTLTYIINGANDEQNAKRRAQGRKPRTGRRSRGSVNCAATTLRQWAEFCRRRNWLPAGVSLEREIFTPKKDQGADSANPRVKFGPDDWPELLDAAGRIHARVRIAVALGLYCGRRVSEIVRVQWKHLDFDSAEITFFNVKSGRPFRIPLPAALLPELARWREWAEANYGPIQSDWHLVPARVPNPEGVNVLVRLRRQPWLWPVEMSSRSSTETVIRDVSRVLTALGIDTRHMNATHALRRSGGSHVERTLGIDAASALLDHACIATTQKSYTGNSRGHDKLRALAAPTTNVVPLRREAG